MVAIRKVDPIHYSYIANLLALVTYRPCKPKYFDFVISIMANCEP